MMMDGTDEVMKIELMNRWDLVCGFESPPPRDSANGSRSTYQQHLKDATLDV